MYDACTQEDIQAFEQCVSKFFTKRPVLQNTPPRADAKDARTLKTSQEITDSWKTIMDRRRQVKPNDRCLIQDKATRDNMHNEWWHECKEWELTPEPREKKGSNKKVIRCIYQQQLCWQALRHGAVADRYPMGTYTRNVDW